MRKITLMKDNSKNIIDVLEAANKILKIAKNGNNSIKGNNIYAKKFVEKHAEAKKVIMELSQKIDSSNVNGIKILEEISNNIESFFDPDNTETNRRESGRTIYKLYKTKLEFELQKGKKPNSLLGKHGTRDEFFAQFDVGGIHTFFLLQIDMANHTKWFEEKQPEKNIIKKELATLFTDELMSKHEFYRLFWAGDGGVFVRTSEATQNYDVVVQAADVIYYLFDKWKKKYNKFDTKLLGIRVSAHISQIFADKDPGFWTSKELNNFIKYERKISGKGFAVTEQIRDKLSTSKLKRFSSPQEEIKSDDGITIMHVFHDSIHKLK